MSEAETPGESGGRTFGEFDFSNLDRPYVSGSTELVADFSGLSEDQAIRAAALQAAASTHAVSAYGGSAPDKDVIRTAARYAYWIHTGEMPDA